MEPARPALSAQLTPVARAAVGYSVAARMLRLFSAPVRVKPTAKTIMSSVTALPSWAPVSASAADAARHSGGNRRGAPNRSMSRAMAMPPITPPKGIMAAMCEASSMP